MHNCIDIVISSNYFTCFSLQSSCSLYQDQRSLNKRWMRMHKNRTGSARRWDFSAHVNVRCSSHYYLTQYSNWVIVCLSPLECLKVQALQSARDQVSVPQPTLTLMREDLYHNVTCRELVDRLFLWCQGNPLITKMLFISSSLSLFLRSQ